MDFLTKIFKPTKSGSGPSVKSANPPQKSEHETCVEIAREFVEELVENIPANSRKDVQASKYCALEDSTSISSIVSSEKFCDTLPDLLQPESIYKKQTDTDTETSHTTEYESAVETDVNDTSSLNESLIVDEVFDGSENVDQQFKCQEENQIVPLSEAQVFSKDDLSTIITLDGSSKTVSCEFLDKNTSGENVLMPYEVGGKSDVTFYDCIEVGESADITVLPQGDITALCADLANLDLNTSSDQSTTVLLQNCDEEQNNSTSQLHNSLLSSSGVDKSQNNSVVDNSFVSSNLETVHLVETEEHELSVLVLDKTFEVSTIPELKIPGDIGKLIDNTDSNVDALTLHNCITFQHSDKESALHVSPKIQEEDTIQKGPKDCEPTKSLSHQTSETVTLSPEKREPFCPGTKQEAPIEEPAFGVPPCQEENTNFEVNKECGDQELNTPLHTHKLEQGFDSDCTWEKNVTSATSGEPSKYSAKVDSSTIGDINLNFKELKIINAKESDSAFKSEKELIDKFNLIIKEGGEPVTEKISPSSEEGVTFVTEDTSSIVNKEKESLITEFTCFEESKGVSTDKCNLTCESLKESIVEEVPFIVDPVTKSPVEESLTSNENKSENEITYDDSSKLVEITSDEKNKSVVEFTSDEINKVVEITCDEDNKSIVQVNVEVIEPQVDRGTDTHLHQSSQQIEPVVKDEQLVSLIQNEVKLATDKDEQVSLEKSKYELLNKTTVEYCYSDNEEKSSQQIPVSFNCAEDSKTPEVFVVTEKVSAASPSRTTHTFAEKKQVSEQTPEKCSSVGDITSLTQVVQNLSDENKSPVKTSELVEETAEAIKKASVTSVSFSEERKTVKAQSIVETCATVNSVQLNSPGSINLPEGKLSSDISPEPVKKLSGSTALVTSVALSSPSKTTPQKPLEVIDTNTKARPILPELGACDTTTVFECTEVSDETNITHVVNSSASLVDFDDLAAEAANVSNDFLTASQEVGEPDFIGESETVVHLTDSVTMSDKGSTQKSDSIPLDVKWLADTQSKMPSNRSSSVTGVNSIGGSPVPMSDTRSSVIGCTNEEDPFKRRSLLQNSPPRDVVLPNIDNKCAMPSHPAIKMEKGVGETVDVKENHSEAGPDTAESFNIPGEELFKDPSAFEFLSSMASTQPVRDYRKESLYVKFDPLVGSAPISRSDKNIPLPPAMQENKRENDTSVKIEVSESPSHVTPVKNPALDMIDRLISLSPSPKKPEVPKPPPVVKQEPVNIPHSTKEYEEMIDELHVLRELLDQQDKAHHEEMLKYQSENEALKNKLNVIQQRNQEAEEREQKLNKKIIDKAQGQKQMSMIMEEYEKTISRLVAEKEAEHQAHELEKEVIIKEKDLALGHLTNIEIAFSDVHLKYERCKNVIEGFKKNEEVLRSSLAEFESTIHKQEQKYEMLKSHAMQQLETANQELDAVKRSQDAENAKLKAMLKKSELKTSSLEEMLEQKCKENQELVAICDDLISKVGN